MSDQKRIRSADHECRRCSLCEDQHHCWMEAIIGDEEDDGDFPQEQRDAAAFNDGCLWICRHCPAWMDYMGDDDAEETDMDSAWENAVEVTAT